MPLAARRAADLIAMDMCNGYGREPDEQETERTQEARTRWQAVHHLAAIGQCDEAVRAQREFLDWARDVLSPDQLLWVMSGDAQALCWVAIGRHEEWLAIFRELLERLNRRSTNRVERLNYLRTAGLVLTRLGRRDDALRVAGMIRDLLHEDPAWERVLWARIEASVIELRLYEAAGDRVRLRREAAAVAGALERGGQQAVEAGRLNELLAYVRGILEDPSQ
jgi:hypothetical protein